MFRLLHLPRGRREQKTVHKFVSNLPTFWKLVPVFGITMIKTFKCVQTRLLFIQWFVKLATFLWILSEPKVFCSVKPVAAGPRLQSCKSTVWYYHFNILCDLCCVRPSINVGGQHLQVRSYTLSLYSSVDAGRRKLTFFQLEERCWPMPTVCSY